MSLTALFSTASQSAITKPGEDKKEKNVEMRRNDKARLGWERGGLVISEVLKTLERPRSHMLPGWVCLLLRVSLQHSEKQPLRRICR